MPKKSQINEYSDNCGSVSIWEFAWSSTTTFGSITMYVGLTIFHEISLDISHIQTECEKYHDVFLEYC